MGYDTKFLISLHRKMLLIRQFEERVKYLFLEGVASRVTKYPRSVLTSMENFYRPDADRIVSAVRGLIGSARTRIPKLEPSVMLSPPCFRAGDPAAAGLQFFMRSTAYDKLQGCFAEFTLIPPRRENGLSMTRIT